MFFIWIQPFYFGRKQKNIWKCFCSIERPVSNRASINLNHNALWITRQHRDRSLVKYCTELWPDIWISVRDAIKVPPCIWHLAIFSFWYFYNFYGLFPQKGSKPLQHQNSSWTFQSYSYWNCIFFKQRFSFVFLKTIQLCSWLAFLLQIFSQNHRRLRFLEKFVAIPILPIIGRSSRAVLGKKLSCLLRLLSRALALYLHEDLSTVTAAVTRNQMVRFPVLMSKCTYKVLNLYHKKLKEK